MRLLIRQQHSPPNQELPLPCNNSRNCCVIDLPHVSLEQGCPFGQAALERIRQYSTYRFPHKWVAMDCGMAAIMFSKASKLCWPRMDVVSISPSGMAVATRRQARNCSITSREDCHVVLGWLAGQGDLRRYFSVSTDKAANPVSPMGGQQAAHGARAVLGGGRFLARVRAPSSRRASPMWPFPTGACWTKFSAPVGQRATPGGSARRPAGSSSNPGRLARSACWPPLPHPIATWRSPACAPTATCGNSSDRGGDRAPQSLQASMIQADYTPTNCAKTLE